MSDRVVELSEELGKMRGESERHESELRLCEAVIKDKDKE